MTAPRLLIVLFLCLSGSKQSNGESVQQQKLQGIVVEFFRFKGVTSLVFVTCPESSVEYQMLPLLKNILKHEFFISVFSSGTPQEFRIADSLKSGIVMDLNCPHSAEILKQAEVTNLFRTNNFWLLLSTSFVHAEKILNSVFIPANGEVMVLTKKLDNLKWILLDVYKVAKYKPLEYTLVSSNITSPTDIIRCLAKYGYVIPKRKNLGGIYLKCGLVISFPDIFTTIDDLRMRHIDTISRVSYPITTNLKQDLNFRFDLIQMDNYGWSNNGTFDGLVGHMQRGNIEFCANAIFMRMDRIPVVHFSAEAFKFRACLMFRQPPLSAVANIFALPFAVEVWWSILLFFIVTSFVMITQIVHPRYSVNMGYLDCFIFGWGAICQQEFYGQVTARSGRILIFTTFVTTLFLFTSFSANIVALLQSPSEAIATIEDLIQSPLDVGVQDTVYNKVFFKETSNPVTQLLFVKKIKPKGENVFMRPNLGIEKMRTGLFSFQVEAQTGYEIISDTFSEQEKCGLKELEPFQLPISGFAVGKDFPYRELFRQRLRWQREVGLMHRENLRWFPQKPVCENNLAGFVSIGITECRYALIMFGIGICISLGILLLESIYYRVHNAKILKLKHKNYIIKSLCKNS